MNQLEITQRSERRLNAAFNSVIVLLILSVLFYLMQQCDADQVRAEDNLPLRLVQCVRAECDECDVNPREKDAIAWVLKKQAQRTGRTLLAQTMAYCAVFDRRNARALSIWSSTFDAPKHGSAKWWSETRRWSTRFLHKPPPDPLPRAMHWGGNMDIHRAVKMGWKRVAGPPEYSNTFWSDL